MTEFTFHFDTQTITEEGNTDLEAMEKANKRLPLGDGAWFPAGKDEFRWVEGNFFD